MFRSIFHRCLDGLWGPRSLKMSTSCTREAHFHKIAFCDSGMILEAKMMKKGSQNRAEMVLKVDEKINENSIKIELGGVVGPLEASWSALLVSLSVLGASWERLESILERLGAVPVASRSPKGTPPGPQDGPKILQKSIQNRIVFLIDF